MPGGAGGELKLTRRREHACRLNRLASSVIRRKMIRFHRHAFRLLLIYSGKRLRGPASILTWRKVSKNTTWNRTGGSVRTQGPNRFMLQG